MTSPPIAWHSIKVSFHATLKWLLYAYFWTYSQGYLPFLQLNFGGHGIPELCHAGSKIFWKLTSLPLTWERMLQLQRRNRSQRTWIPPLSRLTVFLNFLCLPFPGLETRHCASLPLYKQFKIQCCTRAKYDCCLTPLPLLPSAKPPRWLHKDIVS